MYVCMHCTVLGGYAKELALELNGLFDSVWCPLQTWVQIVLAFAVSTTQRHKLTHAM